MKVYLLRVGEYSDQQCLAVFDEEHKQEAEKLAKWMGGYVDEFEMNKFDHEEPPEGLKYYEVEMTRDGKVKLLVEPYYMGGVLYWDGKRQETFYKLFTQKDYKWERASYWRLRAHLYAKSEEHAIKIMNDLRIQILAGQKPAEGKFAI